MKLRKKGSQKRSLKVSLAPLGRQSFRKQISLCLLFQFLTMTPALTLSSFGYHQNRVDLQFYGLGLLLITQFLPAVWVHRRKLLQNRLLDIYPKMRPIHPFWMAAYWTCPLALWSLVTFLLVKNKRAPTVQAPMIFRKPIWTAAMLGILIFAPVGLQTFSLMAHRSLGYDRWAYWLSNPSAYYIASLSDEVGSLIQLKEKLKVAPDHPNPVPAFQELSKSHDFSTTGFILMSALTVKYQMEERKLREPSSTSKEVAMMNMVEDLTTLLELSDHTPPVSFRFNPISFFSPSGAMEVALISGITLLIDSKFLITFFPKIYGILQTLGTESTDTKTLNRLAHLRTRLEATNRYRAYLSVGSTLIGRILSP